MSPWFIVCDAGNPANQPCAKGMYPVFLVWAAVETSCLVPTTIITPLEAAWHPAYLIADADQQLVLFFVCTPAPRTSLVPSQTLDTTHG